MRPGGGRRRARFILPGLYLALAAYVWWDFTRTAHDGLANLGLFAVTLPVTAVGFLIDAATGTTGFSLMPSGHGYLTDHALYYVPAVAVTAALFWWIGRAIDRRPSGASGEKGAQ